MFRRTRVSLNLYSERETSCNSWTWKLFQGLKRFRITKAVNNIVQQMGAFICLGCGPHASPPGPPPRLTNCGNHNDNPSGLPARDARHSYTRLSARGSFNWLLLLSSAIYAHQEHYATGRKVAGSRPDEIFPFISIYLILPPAIGTGVPSTPNRNEYQKQKNNILRSRARPVRRADNLTAICEPTV
jgi:hypothetical protein